MSLNYHKAITKFRLDRYRSGPYVSEHLCTVSLYCLPHVGWFLHQATGEAVQGLLGLRGGFSVVWISLKAL